MSEFNFKSAICTSREQSERLLALGLKKETADMCLEYNAGNYTPKTHRMFLTSLLDRPAWSLHRLIEMIPVHVPFSVGVGHLCINRERIFYWGEEVVYEWWDNGLTIYDNIISCIEWLIKEGYFNKEYLCEK
jgi:hypothetical protein